VLEQQETRAAAAKMTSVRSIPINLFIAAWAVLAFVAAFRQDTKIGGASPRRPTFPISRAGRVILAVAGIAFFAVAIADILR
jgi:hypothetical protein